MTLQGFLNSKYPDRAIRFTEKCFGESPCESFYSSFVTMLYSVIQKEIIRNKKEITISCFDGYPFCSSSK